MCNNTQKKKAAGAGKDFTLFFGVILHFNFKCVSLVTSCLCSKFHRFLLLRTIIRHFKNLFLLRVPLASSLVWNVSLKFFAPPAVINPLSVSIQKSGKKRLILELRHVNQYLFKSKFRCEDVSIAREVLNPGDFTFFSILSLDTTT